MLKCLKHELARMNRRGLAVFRGWITTTLIVTGMTAGGLYAQELWIPEENGAATEMRSEMSRSWKRTAAESALRQGFSAVAASLYAELISADSADEMRIDYATALIASGRAAEVIPVLEGVDAQDDPAWMLRMALARFQLGQKQEARDLVSRFPPTMLDGNDRAWYFLVSALLLEGEGEIEAATGYFRQAMELATTPALRVHFELLRMRNLLRQDTLDEGLISELRVTERTNLGRRSGFEAGRLLAIRLFQSGRRDEALGIVERQLRTPGVNETGMRDEFLLLLGMIAGPESGRGRLALEQLLIESADTRLQELALQLLTQSALRANNNATAHLEFLATLLDGEIPHPLEDRMLAGRIFIRMKLNEDEAARTDAERILQEHPDSPYAPEALRILAYLSWRADPPLYRTAADYLGRLREALPSGSMKTRLGILVADCFFLNGDFLSAADVYGSVLEEVDPETRGQILFQQVLAEISVRRFQAAMDHLDRAAENYSLGAEDRWKAEWNLIDAMKRAGLLEDAFRRLSAVLSEEPAQDLSPALRLRLGWLRAQLTLETGGYEQVPEMANRLLAFLDRQTEGTLSSGEVAESRAHILLLRGEAEFAVGRNQAGQATFQELRDTFPLSGPTILSYLIEARDAAEQQNLTDSQQNLVRLADQFPDSEFAPIALWEAALSAERRGTNDTFREAITILERLVQDYPDHRLVYFARLKQADLSRQLNDFGSALLLYERLLRQFPEHPQILIAQLSRADCLVARGSLSAESVAEGVAAYQRIFERTDISPELRVEAGYKWANAVEQFEGTDAAQPVYWQVYFAMTNDNEVLAKLRSSGRYWLGRTALDFARILENAGDVRSAQRIYREIVARGLPGINLARERILRSADNPS